MNIVAAIIRELLSFVERLTKSRGEAQDADPDRSRLVRGGARIREWLQSRRAGKQR